MTKARSLKH